MGALRVGLLLAGSTAALVSWRRIPSWLAVLVVAVTGVVTRVVPWHATERAATDLAPALAFLVVAVPLAVLLDRTGFFVAVAARVDGGRHLLLSLWLLAAATTIVCNLDAAVVLLTPLYLRIAARHGHDALHVAMIPALLASLASSVLPVSNLTNLIVAGRLDLTSTDFLTRLALPSAVAITVGAVLHLRAAPPAGAAPLTEDPVPAGAMRIGVPVVVLLLVGFTVGDRWGMPAWVVGAIALAILMAQQRCVPWRELPVAALAIAGGLGVVATAAAAHLPVDELLSVRGAPGDVLAVGVLAAGANAVNNLPALLLTLPGLDVHPSRVWAVLLGVNLGPTLWITGALSTLLWQSTLERLGRRVTAREYARFGIRAGLPAIAAATATLVLTAR